MQLTWSICVHSVTWCRMEDAKNRKFCTDRGMSMVLASVRVFPVGNEQQKMLTVFHAESRLTSAAVHLWPHSFPAHRRHFYRTGLTLIDQAVEYLGVRL